MNYPRTTYLVDHTAPRQVRDRAIMASDMSPAEKLEAMDKPFQGEVTIHRVDGNRLERVRVVQFETELYDDLAAAKGIMNGLAAMALVVVGFAIAWIFGGLL